MKYILKNNRYTLFTLIVLSFLLIYLTNSYILTNDFYEKSAQPFSGDPAMGDRVYKSLQVWIYPAAAAYIITKTISIALILYTALYLTRSEVPYHKIFNVVVLSEYIFLFPAAIKIAWFYFHQIDSDLLSWQRYYAGSVLSLVPNAPADWHYVLQTMNVFEVAYWFVLGYGLARISGNSYDSSLRIVMLSYVPALIIWVIAITFCSLLMFPSTG